LSENPDWNVLLLEAGGDELILGQVPGNCPTLERGEIDWQYKTIPQSSGACSAFNNKEYELLYCTITTNIFTIITCSSGVCGRQEK